jgi:sulfoxide reductase catalytic subunit YedY
MLIKRRRGWEIPESEAAPEAVFVNRRCLMKLAGAGAILATAAPFVADEMIGRAGAAGEPGAADPSADLYPVKRNDKYKLDRAITDEKYVTTYNNFYEFGSQKEIWREAQALPLRPWQVKFDGLVEKEKTVDIDDLLKAMPLQERLYRHRCVEAWSIAVPWSGFPMKALLDFAKPLGSAKYVRMETFTNSRVAPGQKQFWYPWPYVEGLTMAEAANEITFMGTGAYGKPMPKQNGATLRLIVPCKYGFKSIKSIVRISFTEKRPVGFWEALQASEYGFWANVNPAVPHPRWSQATERLIGTDERRPTLIWNGYCEFVAHLYDNLKDQRLFA